MSEIDLGAPQVEAAVTALPDRPTGEYAIVEVLGHRTIVGRVSEVQRFGATLLAVEPIWQDELLPPVLIGGASIYQLTSCSAEVAFARQPKHHYNLPDSIRATVPEPEPEFAPRFLTLSACDDGDQDREAF